MSDGELQATTKTGGTRVVDLTERVTGRLRVRLANLQQDVEAEGQELDEDALVFATAHGNVLDHSNVVRRFRALLKKAALNRLPPLRPAPLVRLARPPGRRADHVRREAARAREPGHHAQGLRALAPDR